jgi:hypothetical protein
MLNSVSIRRLITLSSNARKLTRCRYLNYFTAEDLIPYAGKFTNTGAMKTQPKQTKFGLIKVFLLTIPAVLFGAFVSNKGAEILEESELFVPDD